MRGIGISRARVKEILDGQYRFLMLAMMGVELALLSILVLLELFRR